MLVVLSDSALPKSDQLLALRQRSHGHGPLFEGNRHEVSGNPSRFESGGGALVVGTGAPSGEASLTDGVGFDNPCDRSSQTQRLSCKSRTAHSHAVHALVDRPIDGRSGNFTKDR